MNRALLTLIVTGCLFFVGCQNTSSVNEFSDSNSVVENRTVANPDATLFPTGKTIEGKGTVPERQAKIDEKNSAETESSLAASKPTNPDFIPGNRRSKLPSFIKGTWEIARYVEIGGHAYEKPDLAQAEIGKQITLDKFKVEYDQNFLFFGDTCENVVYKTTKHPFRYGDKGTLWFYDLPEAQRKRAEDFIVECNGKDQYYFEVTKDKQLSIYYDGWFFILKKP